MKTRLIISTIIISFSISLHAQDSDQVMSQIKAAIKSMNASALASHFSDRIDLETPGIDGSYSKNQAEVIINDFFKKEPLKSFTINHQGSSNDGSKYMIGIYINKFDKEYRVYILIKISGDNFKINQLQFEED